MFVKNLNFDTTDQDLEKVRVKLRAPFLSLISFYFFFVQHFSSIGACRATVAKKKDPKHPGQLLSMGYGFVEFSSRQLLDEALKQLQNSELQGHQLELKRSERTTKSK